MKCPECNTKMSQVKTESHYGLDIALDQCPDCGGLWFDKRELFRARHGAAKKIDPIDTAKLKEYKTFGKDELFCPKDNFKLELFKDPCFPQEIKVESCQECGGFWFNRGEFASFQEYRKPKQEKEKKEVDEKLEQQVKQLFAIHGRGSKYDSVASLAGFLSTPIDRYSLRPIRYGEEPAMRRGAIYRIIMDIIIILLRIFLRR